MTQEGQGGGCSDRKDREEGVVTKEGQGGGCMKDRGRV